MEGNTFTPDPKSRAKKGNERYSGRRSVLRPCLHEERKEKIAKGLQGGKLL